MMEAIRSSETYVLTSATRRNIPEDGILKCTYVRKHSARDKFLNIETVIDYIIKMDADEFYLA
jgi:hypothetical protein